MSCDYHFGRTPRVPYFCNTPPPHPGTSGCSRAPATSPKPPAPPEQPRRRRLPGPDAGRVEGLGQFRAVFLASEGFRGLGVSGSLGV